MNREPVNPDDPQLTDYALDEMSSSDRAEFEAKLEKSPIAQAELESMEEIMGLLSKGLKDEWCLEMKEPNLEVMPALDQGKVIAPPQFNPGRRILTAAAAAVVALFLAGGAIFTQMGPTELVSNSVDATASVLDAVDPLILADVESPVSVPQLFLAEEVDDLASLELVDALQDLKAPVDASYLEASAVIPVSQGTRLSAARTGIILPGSKKDRVDSYLPPVGSGVVRYGIETGLFDRVQETAPRGSDPSRVIVRGYVSMDGSGPQEQALSGFRPVSMIGNPVLDSETDLELISNFQQIQRDLGELAQSLPEDSALRVEMEQLYERNRAALSALKREFVR